MKQKLDRVCSPTRERDGIVCPSRWDDAIMVHGPGLLETGEPSLSYMNDEQVGCAKRLLREGYTVSVHSSGHDIATIAVEFRELMGFPVLAAQDCGGDPVIYFACKKSVKTRARK